MKLVYQYMAIFFTFPPTSNHLYPLQVENCGSNSRLVVNEDDNGKFSLERVKHRNLQMLWLNLKKKNLFPPPLKLWVIFFSNLIFFKIKSQPFGMFKYQDWKLLCLNLKTYDSFPLIEVVGRGRKVFFVYSHTVDLVILACLNFREFF